MKLRYVDKKSPGEIGLRLGRSTGAINARLGILPRPEGCENLTGMKWSSLEIERLIKMKKNKKVWTEEEVLKELGRTMRAKMERNKRHV